jgi:hypothetical protein
MDPTISTQYQYQRGLNFVTLNFGSIRNVPDIKQSPRFFEFGFNVNRALQGSRNIVVFCLTQTGQQISDAYFPYLVLLNTFHRFRSTTPCRFRLTIACLFANELV